MKTFLLVLAGTASLAIAAEKPFAPLENTLLDPNLASITMLEVMNRYHGEVSADRKAMNDHIRDQMKKDGFVMADMDVDGFEWVSNTHEGLRAKPKRLTLFGKPVGEVLIRANVDKVGAVTVSLFNRGDDGAMSTVTFEKMFTEWKTMLDEKLGVAGESHDSKGAVNLRGVMWRKDRIAWLLESSIGKGEQAGSVRAEFMRIRIASLDAATAKQNQVNRRSSLTEHVVKDTNGDVYIDGIPMVDQGEKGYCAVATVERVARYFGLEFDQHEMAQIANTSESGTSPKEMEKALMNVTGKIHVKTTKHYDYDMHAFESDVRAYNQLAKKSGRDIPVKRDEILNPAYFAYKADPDIFDEVKKKQTGFQHFKGKIQEYIDQGIPVCWALELGMFKEEGLPQSRGGHMRLIIGYNKTTDELFYSDSWGKGHELKKMPASHAYCMTLALYTLAPTR